MSVECLMFIAIILGTAAQFAATVLGAVLGYYVIGPALGKGCSHLQRCVYQPERG